MVVVVILVATATATVTVTAIVVCPVRLVSVRCWRLDVGCWVKVQDADLFRPLRLESKRIAIGVMVEVEVR